MTVCSNDTLVDTPFQLISGFLHVNKVFSLVQGCVGGEGGGATGGGEQQACKQQAVEFPQVLTNIIIDTK